LSDDRLDGLLAGLRPIVGELVEQELAARLAEIAPPAWMTLEEAADYLRTTKTALRQRAHRGQVPHVVDGHRLLFDRRALDEALVSNLRGNNANKGRAPQQRPRPGTRR
jgi:excisionase family DNA binding protein